MPHKKFMASQVSYSKAEIQLVRGFMERKLSPKAQEQEIRALSGRMKAEGRGHLSPFAGFALEENGLFSKIEADPRIKRLGPFMFLPLLEGRLDSDMGDVSMEPLTARARKWAVKLRIGGKDYAIKQVQSVDEPKVAGIAGGLLAGPVQHPGLENFICEEFIPGALSGQLLSSLSLDDAKFMGGRMGGILRALHAEHILFNDIILLDKFGGSHLMLEFGGNSRSARLIDFGVSLYVPNYPEMTDEQILRHIACLKYENTQLPVDGESRKRIILECRRQFASLSADDFFKRDFHFVSGGLWLAGEKGVAQDILRAIQSEFMAAYHMRQ
jgi:hypothetical protein